MIGSRPGASDNPAPECLFDICHQVDIVPLPTISGSELFRVRTELLWRRLHAAGRHLPRGSLPYVGAL